MLFRAATAAAEMVRSGQISSRELTELALARIDALNPSLNAVVELRPEAALREAATADEVTARGGVMGPLHGVPVTIKEALQVTGCTAPGAIPRSGTLSLMDTPLWCGG